MAGIDRFACITVAVNDQDEALRWFTEKLGFVKRVDQPGPGIRFLTVSPRKQPDLQVILASWFPEHVGKNPTAVLHTDDCRKTYEDLKSRGVVFTEARRRSRSVCKRCSRTYGVTATRFCNLGHKRLEGKTLRTERTGGRREI